MMRFWKKKERRKNGQMKSGSLGTKTPPPERKSKFAALGKLFKPWKWKRRKKSEKIEKTAVDLERKISLRATREELIRKGVLKDVDVESQSNHVNSLEAVKETTDSVDGVQAPSGPLENGQLATSQAGPGVSGANEDHSCSVTTQAQITPFNTNVTLSAAQIRPVIVPIQVQIPKVPPQRDQPIPPIPPSEVPPPEYHTVNPPQPNGHTLPNSSITVQVADVIEPNPGDQASSTLEVGELGEDDEDEDYDNLNPPAPYEAVPASEPDLNRQPVKSALKQKGLNGRPSTPVSVAGSNVAALRQLVEDENRNSQSSPRPGILYSSPAVRVVPLPSPRPTPTTRPTTRPTPRRRERLQVRINENKENIPEPEPPPESEINGDYDNLPGDDSSSDDEEIKYRDDIEITSSLAAKVARQDSLARFLSNRPNYRDLVEKNIIPVKSEAEKIEDRNAIGTKLTRRLSLRPSPEELEQRNILHHQSQEEAKKLLEEKKRYLVRKLSFRPNVEELKEKKIIKFSDYVEVTETHEYDRRADKPWTRLTPKDKAAIRKELNEFKSKEMEVHEDSKHLTRFHRP